MQFALTSACVNGWGAKIIISRRLRSLARTRPIARDNEAYGRIGLFRFLGRRQRKMQRRCRVAALSTFVHPRFTLRGVNFLQQLKRWVTPWLQTWAVCSAAMPCAASDSTPALNVAPKARRWRAEGAPSMAMSAEGANARRCTRSDNCTARDKHGQT